MPTKKDEELLGDPTFEMRTTLNIEDVAEENRAFACPPSFGSVAERARRNLNAKLANPLAGYSHAELRRQGYDFVANNLIGDTADDVRAFELGAVLAQAPENFEHVQGLTSEEREVLSDEFANRWSQPILMYFVIALCSLSAAVQGMGKLSRILATGTWHLSFLYS